MQLHPLNTLCNYSSLPQFPHLLLPFSFPFPSPFAFISISPVLLSFLRYISSSNNTLFLFFSCNYYYYYFSFQLQNLLFFNWPENRFCSPPNQWFAGTKLAPKSRSEKKKKKKSVSYLKLFKGTKDTIQLHIT